MKVLFCDDHRMLSEALSVVLDARGHEMVAVTTRPDEAATVASADHVDVCVMDLGFPDADGIEGIRLLRLASPRTRVVVLSADSHPDRIDAAMSAGASAYVVKGAQPDELIDAIERVSAGETKIKIMPPPEGGPQTQSSSAGGRLARFLTDRELEVLERLVQGQSTSAMAQEMEVAYSTIRTHIQNVLTKLGVHSKIAAVTFAVHHGLAPLKERRQPNERERARRTQRTALG